VLENDDDENNQNTKWWPIKHDRVCYIEACASFSSIFALYEEREKQIVRTLQI
jgi:hypothetical protein